MFSLLFLGHLIDECCVEKKKGGCLVGGLTVPEPDLEQPRNGPSAERFSRQRDSPGSQGDPSTSPVRNREQEGAPPPRRRSARGLLWRSGSACSRPPGPRTPRPRAFLRRGAPAPSPPREEG